MTSENVVIALEAWIDAKIARETARDSWDGGLAESIQVDALRADLIIALNSAIGV